MGRTFAKKLAGAWKDGRAYARESHFGQGAQTRKIPLFGLRVSRNFAVANPSHYP